MDNFKLKFNLYLHHPVHGSITQSGVVTMDVEASCGEHAQALGDALASNMKVLDSVSDQDHYWCEVE